MENRGCPSLLSTFGKTDKNARSNICQTVTIVLCTFSRLSTIVETLRKNEKNHVMEALCTSHKAIFLGNIRH